MIRILRVQSRICVGGPALNSILLSAYMRELGYETLLVGGRLEPDEKSMTPLAETKHVPVDIIDEMGRSIKPMDDVRALWKLMRLIRRYRPHVLHTHTAKAGAIGRLAGFLCGVPVRVHTFHGHVFHGYFSRFISACFVWLERCLALISHRIVVISPRQYKDITQRYRVASKRKTQVVRLGFELDKVKGGQPGHLRKELKVGKDTRLCAILARLVPIKNHALLLDAIAHWRQQHPDVKPQAVQFLIIGDGQLRHDLEAQVARLDLKPWVRFLGWRGDVPAIYADIDLNLLVSRNEGTPVTLIEGLSCGVPLLSTDVGGIRDFADDDCGIIVPPDIGPAQLATHLQHMLARLEDQPRLPESVRQRVSEDYGVRRLVADMDALYRTCLKHKVKLPATVPKQE